MKLGGEELLIMKESDVMGIIESANPFVGGPSKAKQRPAVWSLELWHFVPCMTAY